VGTGRCTGCDARCSTAQVLAREPCCSAPRGAYGADPVSTADRRSGLHFGASSRQRDSHAPPVGSRRGLSTTIRLRAGGLACHRAETQPSRRNKPVLSLHLTRCADYMQDGSHCFVKRAITMWKLMAIVKSPFDWERSWKPSSPLPRWLACSPVACTSGDLLPNGPPNCRRTCATAGCNRRSTEPGRRRVNGWPRRRRGGHAVYRTPRPVGSGRAACWPPRKDR